MVSLLNSFLACIGAAGLTAIIFSVVLTVKNDKIYHLKELIRLHMTNGGQVRTTKEEVEVLLSADDSPQALDMRQEAYKKLHRCTGGCDGYTVNFSLKGADLVAATNLHNHRSFRTS